MEALRAYVLGRTDGREGREIVKERLCFLGSCNVRCGM